ncbi:MULTISPECIES: 5-carboxymethyl-2-hydroxymuconate Delta-isomerase [Thalassospira]|uniref:5-carboxymethyl-2-hydroxymuconate isomerase n=2 Tax=Thalassospira TaxID=168934 RepID=A0A367WH87_9PROT|nr:MULTISPECIES: 5-carboxymethyl-2-hydroxymuconate isomerase [Thalassospira]MDG4718903.1 5-carboxymethyl-2-hydroxymuconate isomerase [Thalassospira sp. FZY0004]RCK39870.1 5-carboxymethyl-2-hydroxymuconate isomerase [Thalassospira profundimaris]
MPQLEIEYSAKLPIADELPKLAVDLHYVVAREADAELESFKTRISPLENVVIADGNDSHAMVHLDIRLLSGRSTQMKFATGEAALAVLRDRLEWLVGDYAVQFTVEVHDLDRANYHKHVTKTRQAVV